MSSPRMPSSAGRSDDRSLAKLAGLLAAVTCAAHGLALGTDNARQSPLDQAVDQAARAFFASGCHVGLSVAAVTPGASFFYDYGSARRDAAALADSTSLYEIASVTKVFTAALAARAVIEHRLSLDGDFRADLPGAFPNLELDDRPITLRWLIAHRSGMPRDIPDTDAIFAKHDPLTRPYELRARLGSLDRRRLIAALHGIRLRQGPGAEEHYSNAGYLLVGLGLERVYGQPFEALMERRLLRPLAMRATTFSVPPSRRDRLVTGYDLLGRRMPEHPRSAGAAWGLYSSPEDMARFVRWELERRDPAVILSQQLLLGSESDGVAMPWHVMLDRGEPMLWYSGESFGMTSQVVLFPRQHEGYVLLVNDACTGSEQGLAQLAMAVHRLRWKIP